MHVKASGAPHGHQHVDRVRPANFGQLNSAIARGDVTAAQTAFKAISLSTAASAKVVSARAGLDQLGEALASQDPAKIAAALAQFRKGELPSTTPAPAATPSPATAAADTGTGMAASGSGDVTTAPAAAPVSAGTAPASSVASDPQAASPAT